MTNIFSSRARVRVLRALYYQEAPVPLRHAAYLAQMPVFSIQRALKQLTEEKLVIRKRKRNYRLFSLNRAHPCHPFLSRVFNLERESRFALAPNRYDQKAKSLLAFIGATHDLFKTAKAG
ncbi:MAG: hypothetical protein HYU99_11690 [Deltaproteobacteria bacterium]|nr:hypothetical protein [Deltaproteobacteria bacterium]